ncbi:MAG: short-chain fatty acid transporter [Myxococcota bacterium]
MIRRIGTRFSEFFQAVMPDPFVLAILLTFVVFGLAAAVMGAGPIEILHAWQGDLGFWSLLRFAMQMVLILVTGHALASAPPVARLIARLARVPRTGPGAVALVSLCAMGAALLNWGLGLILGALLAREVGRSTAARGVRAHYPLLAAAGYTGLVCWHGGFSGTSAIKMTTSGDVLNFLGADLATRIGTVPLTQTVLGAENLIVTGGLLVLVPLCCALLAPRGDEDIEPPPPEVLRGTDGAAPEDDEPPRTVPEKLERSRVMTLVVVLPLAAAVGLWGTERGFAQLDPNALNLIFLTTGLLLHGTLRSYVRALTDATRGAAGIVLQFPFYAGIMGVMRGTGLAAAMAGVIGQTTSATGAVLLTVGSAALINLFVPSGGGQWAVQGPVALQAAARLGMAPETAVMAVAYGDQLTNMLQPFWALPLLAVTGVRARDIVGFTAVVMLVAAAWIALVLAVMTW